MDIATGSLRSFIYRVLGSLFLAALMAVVARALPVAEFGQFRETIVVIAAVAAIGGSFGNSAGYFVSNRGRPAAEVAVNGTLLCLAIGLALLVLSGIAWLVYDGPGRNLIPLVGVSIFPIIGRHALGGVFVGTNALWRFSFANQGYGYVALALVLAWVVALGHASAAHVLGVWIIAQYLTFLIVAFSGWRWWSWLLEHRPDVQLMRQIVSFGAVAGLAGVVSYFNYRVDILLVAGLDGDAGAGIYSAAVTVAEGLWLFSSSIAVASYARIGSLGRDESAQLAARGVRHSVLVVTALALPIVVLAPFLLDIIFGGAYGEGGNTLRILVLGTLVYAPQTVLSTYFTVQLGRPWIPMSLAVGSVTVSIIVSVLLITGDRLPGRRVGDHRELHAFGDRGHAALPPALHGAPGRPLAVPAG
ncbi:MAG: oligosaccharide flippase family protein [Dehalococcoidia bacterium]|nr:oligosaccharide flippase family protein [Dehalococcoidia bacterium]